MISLLTLVIKVVIHNNVANKQDDIYGFKKDEELFDIKESFRRQRLSGKKTLSEEEIEGYTVNDLLELEDKGVANLPYYHKKIVDQERRRIFEEQKSLKKEKINNLLKQGLHDFEISEYLELEAKNISN